MIKISRVKKFNASEWVTPEAFNVTPNLLGMPLARPSQRAMAIALDGLVIALLSSTGASWILIGIVVVLFQLKKINTQSWKRKIWLWLALLVMVTMAITYVTSYTKELNTPQKHGEAVVDENDEVVEVGASVSAAASAAIAPSSASAPASVPASASEAAAITNTAAKRRKTDAERIAKLEHDLKAAQTPKIFKWRDELEDWIKTLGNNFGWAIAYFTLLPFWWQGQTLGKKVFGLRIVELTGKPLTLMMCFGRYGGYAAGMATGMIGFVQVLWDVNRQAIQDKIAHTVVIDLRQARRLDLLDANAMAIPIPEDKTQSTQIANG